MDNFPITDEAKTWQEEISSAQSLLQGELKAKDAIIVPLSQLMYIDVF